MTERVRTAWHRPRRFALLAIAVGLVAVGLVASVAVAALVEDSGTHSVIVPNKETSSALVSIGDASVMYIGSAAQNQASGTGLFDPFVRLQNDTTEKGYNTDGAVEFNTKSGQWTHAIKASAIPIVDCDGADPGTATCWELFVDINDANNAKYISLTDVEIWFTLNANLIGYDDDPVGTGFPAPATKEYDFSGEIQIHDVNQGSGRGDLLFLVPTDGHPFTSDTFFVLFSKWGSSTAAPDGKTFGSDGGFEEWKVRKAPNVGILKTANPVGPVNAGATIGFDITVSNTGAAAAPTITFTDNLPAGAALNWSLNPAFSGCSIAGAVGSQVLTCSFTNVAAGASVGPIHVQSPTTAADCAVVPNTAVLTAGGIGQSSASVTVQCAAIRILKNSTKGGAVANAGAVFSVDGPDANTDPDFSVTDDTTAAAPDEDVDIGEVCVSGLVPGATYTINETSPPTGYGGASATNVAVVAVNGNCASAGLNSATFTNPPLFDIQVNFRDGGSGDTAIGPAPAVIDCDTTTGTESTTDATGWSDTLTVNGVRLTSATMTITCTIPVDP